MNTKKAFTLAEVLITLTIIGIVAALTIPTLIHRYERHVLESQFKKMYSTVSQTFYALRIDDLSFVANPYYSEFYDEFFSKFKIKPGPKPYPITQKYKTYTLEDASASNVKNCSQPPEKTLDDGSFIGGFYNCWANWITIDTNGIKGPNAYGHDLFIFFVNTNTGKLVPVGAETTSYGGPYVEDKMGVNCSKANTSAINGVSCTYFAVINKCPWDSTKTYWECLP